METTQMLRRDHVTSVCQLNGLTAKPSGGKTKPEIAEYLYVNDDYQLIYCLVPKVSTDAFYFPLKK